MAEPTLDPIREEQAARIRWLPHRCPPDVYFEFVLKYVPEHPFPAGEHPDG